MSEVRRLTDDEWFNEQEVCSCPTHGGLGCKGQRDWTNGLCDGCHDHAADNARLRRIEEAARALLDITDCYARPFIPPAVWAKADALRAALEDR